MTGPADMRIEKLSPRLVAKPWGRTSLPPIFDATQGDRIGEVWYEGHDQQAAPLLVKYIFTSEKLSIQVHPNDAQAGALGQPRGKSECWYILDCEPGAVLGIGLQEPMTAASFAASIGDGSIEDRLEWHPIAAGDFFYIPAGTVHAIGAGISLVEIQQNSDITYRLYDYGRERALHIDAGT
ncbi:MAG: class I mannose-6-phosphate isomerase [Sphingobium sp.]